MDTFLLFDYTHWLVIHLVGVVLFVGNVTVTAVWKVFADRTHHPATIAFAQRLVTYTDWVFTFGGVVLVLVSGIALMILGGWWTAGAAWLWWGIGLFVVAGLMWLVVLIPIQIRQARMALRFEQDGEVPPAYRRLALRWLWVGIVATGLAAVNLYLMIAKP
ncbi:DUF2269 family protein [uncultured Rhodospira sp.]|uniref:DUF2269 family protein n=1 Tax=uncultured Rhodospira sp. TaxID=1936189 RepID=UPI002628316F|nr:DUF2269 family protein [uncultured Rhodospira sp.]